MLQSPIFTSLLTNLNFFSWEKTTTTKKQYTYQIYINPVVPTVQNWCLPSEDDEGKRTVCRRNDGVAKGASLLKWLSAADSRGTGVHHICRQDTATWQAGPNCHCRFLQSRLTRAQRISVSLLSQQKRLVHNYYFAQSHGYRADVSPTDFRNSSTFCLMRQYDLYTNLLKGFSWLSQWLKFPRLDCRAECITCRQKKMAVLNHIRAKWRI